MGRDLAFPIEGVVYSSPETAERYLDVGAWHDGTAGDLLREVAKGHPNARALVSEEGALTYLEWDEMSERLAGALLEHALRPGDRAIFQMGTTIDTAIALMGCFKAGIVPVCSLPMHREKEIVELGERSKAKAYFVQSLYGRHDLETFAVDVSRRISSIDTIIASARSRPKSGVSRLHSLVEGITLEQARALLRNVSPTPRDVLSFQLSGGSTSTPKIIPRFHGEYLGQARDWSARHHIVSGSSALYALPLIHNAGQIAMMIPVLLHGGKLVLMQKMEPAAFLSIVEQERVTHSLSIGPIAAQLLDYPDVRKYDLSSLECLMSFSGSDRLERHLGARCTNIFGITEGLLMSSGPDAGEQARFETVGWPVSELDEVRVLMPGSEIEVPTGHTGELCFRGPSVLTGYFDMDEVNRTVFTSDGYFRTGDLVRALWKGTRLCYAFEGRIKDNIDRGGEKFGAEEVEVAIAQHPCVLDAKVVAMPDRILGEKACAFIIARQGLAAPSLEELSEFLLHQGLAKFKLPERIETIDAFPVTSVGKVDKQALRNLVSERLSKAVSTERNI